MYLFQQSTDLQNLLQSVRGHNRKIGFVPTMGALHAGHLSLIRQSKAANSLTICSIFVNPTQFNDAADLEKYPRTPSQDIELLVKEACDVLFMPKVAEVYPKNIATKVSIDLGTLDQVLEGQFRPGHFAGVVEVVNRLLQLVTPDRLYMGQKDFQQFTIIQEMIQQLKLPVELIVVDIKREADGLAMSSRNVRLSTHFRAIAPTIFEVLQQTKVQINSKSIPALKSQATNILNACGLKTEYFEIVDGYTLANIETAEEHDYIVACVATWADDVRLIDNIILKR